MSFIRRLVALLGVVALVAVAWLVLNRFLPQPNELDSPHNMSGYQSNITPEFVGSARCRDCHAELTDQFARHPMASSMRLLADDDQTLYAPSLHATIDGKQRGLIVEAQDNQLIHSERAFDTEGQLIYTQPHAMKYVVGSGRRARAYLERRGELLFMSPINWYRQSQAWNLAPGYLPDDVRRFDRRVRDDCLACHSGRPVIKQPSANIYPEPIFHETGIGCERCHGPGSSHIAFQERPGNHDAENDPIVNPQKLDVDRRDAVCYQCHLESAARVLRPGKSHLDFRPGMQLSDIWAILDQGTQVTASGHTRLVNHVQQMRDSRCYIESQGKLGCTSCHDPHNAPKAEQRVSVYRERCLKCHTNDACNEQRSVRDQQQDDCLACHMPSLSSSNIAHVAQTDHRVLRRPESTNDQPSAKSSSDREISLNLFGSAMEQLSPSEKQRALVIGTVMYCQRKAIPLPATVLPMLEQERAKSGGDTELLTKLGGLYLDKSLIDQAESCFREALSIESENEFALDGLLETLYRQAKWSETVAHATKMLAIEPSSARTLAMRADALSHLGRHNEALSDIARAIEVNPSQVVLRQWQVDTLRALERTSEADAAALELERVRTARPS